MRSGSFKIGRAFGIDVRVHWTFFLLLFYFAFVGYRGAGNLVGALATVAVIVALFACVLLHEFGHSLVAQRLGIEIPDITLLPIGGIARLKTLPEKPMDEVKIAVAGPLVNVVLAPIFFGIGVALGADPLTIGSPIGGFGSAGRFFVYLGYINVALVLFNVLPAFPMDGGRVLRGLLASRLGAVRATDIASAVGQLFAAVFLVFGILGGNFILVLIAVFIFFGARTEAEMVRQREPT
jgi:Zn-dependent protease